MAGLKKGAAGKGKRLVIENGAGTEVNAGLVELIKEAFAIRNQFWMPEAFEDSCK